MQNLADHGLPLVALKEQRRDLVMELRATPGPVPKSIIDEIANLQYAITAIEAVISDLDDEICSATSDVVPMRILAS